MDMNEFYDHLQGQAAPLCQLIGEFNAKVVLAESCTGGLVSALLTTFPGISRYHCGSFATYRPTSKRKWLGVPESIIQQYTCESEYMAREMAYRALKQTPEADYSAAVVGHIESLSSENDGCYWIGMANRTTMDAVKPHMTHSYTGKCKEEGRVARQFEIAFKVIEIFEEHLRKHGVPK